MQQDLPLSRLGLCNDSSINPHELAGLTDGQQCFVGIEGVLIWNVTINALKEAHQLYGS